MKSFVQKQEKSLQPEKLSHYTCSTIVWQIPAVLPFQAFGILALKIAGKVSYVQLHKLLCGEGGSIGLLDYPLTWWTLLHHQPHHR